MNETGRPEIYENNMAVLEKRFPAVHSLVRKGAFKTKYPARLFVTGKGYANVAFRVSDDLEIPLYEDEAIENANETVLSLTLEKQDILFFVGAGLGYFPMAAAKNLAVRPNIAILEPRLEILDLALRNVDLRPLLNYKHLDIFAGDISVRSVINLYNLHLMISKCRIVSHLSYSIIFGEKFSALEREVKERVGAIALNRNTYKKFGRDLIANSAANLPSVFFGAPLSRLRGKFGSFPVVYAASGPSLDGELDRLREIGDRALLMAADSAVNALVEAGIRPHMVFTTDMKQLNFEKLRAHMDQLRETILVFYLEACPDNVRAYLGDRRVAAASATALHEHMLGPLFNIDCRLGGPVNSVSTTALFTAAALGADPIILVGMDMACPGGMDHSKGVILRQTKTGDEILTDGANGLPVHSLPPFLADKTLIENEIGRFSSRFVHTSIDGLLIKGAEIKTLEEILETETEPGNDVRKILNGLDWSPTVSEKELVGMFESMCRNFSSFKAECKKGVSLAGKAIKSGGKGRALKTAFDLFKKIRHGYENLTNMLEPAQSGLHELIRRDYHLGRKGGGNEHALGEAMQMMEEFFRLQSETAEFFSEILEKHLGYYKKFSELQSELAENPRDREKRLALARLHGSMGELRRAESEYLACMDDFPEEALPFLELAELFISFRLWRPASSLLNKARQNHDDDPQIKKLLERVEHETAALFVEAQSAVKEGNRAAARSPLIDYLSVCPDDEKALRLKHSLFGEEEDMQTKASAEDLPVAELEKLRNSLEEKAKGCMNKGEFEQAAGIYEGLAKKLPEESAVFREKIGDLRFLQRDYPSSRWNYTRAFEKTRDGNVWKKIEHADLLLSGRKIGEQNLGLSVAVPVVNGGKDLEKCVRSISENTPEPYEIIFLVPESDKNAFDLAKRLASEHENRNLVQYGKRTVAAACNKAAESSTGRHFVLLREGTLLCEGWSDRMILCLDRTRNAGIAGPMTNRCQGIQRFPDTGDIKKDNFKAYAASFAKKNADRRIDTDEPADFCIMAKRELFAKIGLFDKRFQTVSGMAREFCIRALIEGYRNVAAGDVFVCRIGNDADLDGESADEAVFMEKYGKKDPETPFGKKLIVAESVREAKKLDHMDRVGEAVDALLGALGHIPGCTETYETLASVLIGAKQYGEALDVVKEMPNEPSGAKQILAGYCHEGLKDFDMAHKCVERALASGHMRAMAFNLKGILAYRKNDTRAAEVLFGKAAETDPGYGEPHTNLGTIAWKGERYVEALDFFEKGFTLSPSETDICELWHTGAVALGAFERAEERFRDAILLHPFHKRLRFSLIDFLLKLGKYENALTEAGKARELFGADEGMDAAIDRIREMIDGNV